MSEATPDEYALELVRQLSDVRCNIATDGKLYRLIVAAFEKQRMSFEPMVEALKVCDEAIFGNENGASLDEAKRLVRAARKLAGE